MLEPTHLRDLDVDPAQHPRAQAHISAASGLAIVGGMAYVVADDEHHLGMFALDDAALPVRLHRLLAGDLPAGTSDRKKRKPDLEALVALPGGLLALGSGSRPQRERGVLLPLQPARTAREVDLAKLYAPLRSHFADLNIEGAFATGDGFHLLQRANRGSAVNACVRYALQDVIAWLDDRAGVPVLQDITAFALGAAGGVPYGFTDAAALPKGGWIFSAVAEDTRDSYADGSCAGSLLGWVDEHGALREVRPLAGSPKAEGIALTGEGRLLLVTDADDPGLASQLLEVNWPALAR